MRGVGAGVANRCTLADLTLGADAKVLKVAGQPGLRQRLLEMGVIPGAPVRLVRVAPLGDPLGFKVKGYQLSLRRAEARTVTVELI